MSTKYERVQELLTGIRNARFGEIVKFNEELIRSGDWQDYRTPVGTHFRFLPCEYDYFLAANEADPTTIRQAYAHAGAEDQRIALAHITGVGRRLTGDERRDRDDVANAYASDPSGAGERIREWSGSLVTDRQGRAARGLPRPDRHRWHIEWVGDRKVADVIAERLLSDPDLAHEVYKILHSWSVGNAAKRKRRSEAVSTSEGPGLIVAPSRRQRAS